MTMRVPDPSQRAPERPPGLDQTARKAAVRGRDATFARLGNARRWGIGATAALSAGLAALAYSLAPGHTLSSARAAGSPTPSTGASSATAPTAAMPPAASPSALGLGGGSGSSSQSDAASAPPSPAAQPPAPATAPAPVQSSPPVVSGGS